MVGQRREWCSVAGCGSLRVIELPRVAVRGVTDRVERDVAAVAGLNCA